MSFDRFPLSLLVVVACSSLGCRETRPEPRLEPPPPAEPAPYTRTVSIARAERIVRGSTVIARLRVANGTAARVFVYAEALATRLDDGGRTLTLVMHEVPSPPTGSSADCHVFLPRMHSVPARTIETVDVDVDRRLAEVAALNIELGWTDRTLALDTTSLCRFETESMLAAAERDVTIARVAW